MIAPPIWTAEEPFVPLTTPPPRRVREPRCGEVDPAQIGLQDGGSSFRLPVRADLVRRFLTL